MSTWSDLGPLLNALGIRHSGVEVHDDILSVVLGRTFLKTKDIVPLLAVAGELHIALILIYYKGLRFQASYLDYIDVLLNGGTINDFIGRWTVADGDFR